MPDFPDLSAWQPTRDGLHAYSRVLGELCKRLRQPHPLWWHASLEVTAKGLSTGSLSLNGESVELILDLDSIEVVVLRSDCGVDRIALENGLSADGLRHAILGRLALEDKAESFAGLALDDSVPHTIEPSAARRFHRALEGVQTVFEETRREICGDCSPIQLWPHHFDLSFERFGPPLPNVDTKGTSEQGRCQIGFGFSPGDDGHPEPYFYANPWPFDPSFVKATLPGGAQWHLDNWQGSLLPYERARQAGARLLRQYLETVYRVAATLVGD